MTCPICDQKPMNCDCTDAERRQYSEISDLEDEVAALRAKLPRWIPVEERLPVVGGRYLVLTDTSSDPFVDAATWSRGVWWSGFSPAEEWGMEITHWMPLPEPPEVK